MVVVVVVVVLVRFLVDVIIVFFGSCCLPVLRQVMSYKCRCRKRPALDNQTEDRIKRAIDTLRQQLR